ncbi:Pantothenate transporter liz1 [Colletotrichum tanaceti]|uniref:Pantothenate transporter liz1 n=1 Tax=Colletotrichum tanaceti TaxID=1306861 RepID=A0A4V6DHG2_9PEZI|nr:Pantothenate transporter liz1 [Colletotrichum tanaceti]TKW56276.1 Pantothenate transporter liz1 [Colletotrichum tanaceti]
MGAPEIEKTSVADSPRSRSPTSVEAKESKPAVTELVQEEPKKLTWRSYVWDTLEKSPEERKFMFKLDAVILTFASLGYFIKNLDQININNAFVSGMKEDMQLFGNELNYMQCTWATLTVLMIKCTNVNQLYVLRFFIGLAESTFYPGMQYIIGCWYRRDELAKRSCIFHSSGAIGSMFSGYLMAAVYNLDGVHGWKGWQWLFVMDGVISLPIAIAGFFFLPDVPEITRAWWLTGDDVALAQRRMRLEGRANRQPYTRAKVKKILTSWHIYALTLLYIFFNNGSAVTGQPAFQLWLKGQGYSLRDYNTYPTITSAITVVTTWIYAWSSDSVFRGERWPPIVFSGALGVVVYSSLAAWSIPDAWKWACFLLVGFGGGVSGLTFAWAHEICKDDNEERAIVTGAMNQMAYVVQAWLPLIIWQQVEAPRYPKGYITMVFFAVGMAGMSLLIRHLHRRELGRKASGVAA